MTTWQRPIRSRYLDPVEVIWLSLARRLGLTVRRDPAIFSRTDGSGMLWLGPRHDLDADDMVCQMLLHEICHWITNGLESLHSEDWGFPLDDADDPREHACLRLQAWLANAHGLRDMLGPTGQYREYFDRIPADPLEPLDDSPWEHQVQRIALRAIHTSQLPPFAPHLQAALQATAAIRGVVEPWLADYVTEIQDDPLPSLWAR